MLISFKFNYPTVPSLLPKKIKVLYPPFFPGGKTGNFYLSPMPSLKCFCQQSLPLHTIFKGNYFLWASANVRWNVLGGRCLNSKSDSHQSVSSFSSTWRETVPDASLPATSHIWKQQCHSLDIKEKCRYRSLCEPCAHALCGRTASGNSDWLVPPCFGDCYGLCPNATLKLQAVISGAFSEVAESRVAGINGL